MKYQIASEQQAFFDHHKVIEFEELISGEKLIKLQKAVNKIQKANQNLKNKVDEYERRDLFRRDAEIKKVVLSSFLAEIGGELTMSKRLRIGFDELYELPLSQKSDTLKSSIQGLFCCLMLCLEGEYDNAPNTITKNGFIDPFPHKPGSGIFFLPQTPWDISALNTRPQQKFLLIAYAHDPAIFKYEENDQYTHFLKKFDYVFGDRLNETYHPTVYKKNR